jgi:cytoskeletal protein CcmA (bactofilin family)
MNQEVIMFGIKSNKPHTKIDTLIGSSTRILGDVHFSGGLRIDGQVKGNVFAEDGQSSTLVVSEQATIEGEIRVTHLVVNGAVTGPVYATEFLELQSKARVTGDIGYSRIEIHLGAVVQGRMLHQSQAPKAVELKLAASK